MLVSFVRLFLIALYAGELILNGVMRLPRAKRPRRRVPMIPVIGVGGFVVRRPLLNRISALGILQNF